MKTRTSLLGILAVVAVLSVPLVASAQEAAIVPDSFDFGPTVVGTSASDEFTITSVIDDDLRIFVIVFLIGDNPTGAFETNVLDPFGDPMEQGTYVTVEVTFTPVGLGPHDATLTIVTNDGTNPIATVSLTGQGIPAGTGLMNEVLEFFESAVGADDLEGAGPGNSAAGRLGAFGNMLLEAYDLIAAGDIEDACGQLEQAYRRTDSEPRPPDFVTGDAADDLADMILEVMEELGCP